MVTIVSISRITKHHEDVLKIERVEPKNESRSKYILPIDGKLKIKFEGVDVSQLIERDTPKKPNIRTEFEDPDWEVDVPICQSCGCDIPWGNFCQGCGQRIDWSK